ncbi:MAG: GNAT family N-acetyltransferase [Anaerovoracaceae bacterium]|jgi:amino-acid N-acetyltransferase
MNADLEMSVTGDYEKLVPFFIANELEFSEDEPVPTDLVRCWQVLRREDGALVGAVVLARREGEFIIDGIAVDASLRGTGVGREMLAAALAETARRGGRSLYLVARAPGFFARSGFTAIPREEAPNFFECFTCPQYGSSCHPQVMRREVQA